MERNIRNAKVSSPCVLVFDDLDSLARSRGSGVKDITDNKGVLSQILTEMEDSETAGFIVIRLPIYLI
jgi:transitional endoplasmic reticulum ATPase